MRPVIALAISLLLLSCSGNEPVPLRKNPTPPAAKSSPANVDDGKGIGAVKQVVINDPLRQDMINRGQQIYELKCAACHKLSDQRVVGPGWKGVTEKRKPEWIMNMITNVDVMLDKDPVARQLLEECLTRMPNQNIKLTESRDLLEFMFANDADMLKEQ